MLSSFHCCFLIAIWSSFISSSPQQTGYPTSLQTDRIHHFHSRNDVVLLTPLGFTKEGDVLNIHSEVLAAFTAGALDASKLVYFSSDPMVLRGSDSNDSSSEQRIQMIERANALQILSHHGLSINSKTGFPHWKSHVHLDNDQQAMLLKMGWATHAIKLGVERAHIIDCEDGSLLEGEIMSLLTYVLLFSFAHVNILSSISPPHFLELFTARRGFGTCISRDGYEAPHPEDSNDDFSFAE